MSNRHSRTSSHPYVFTISGEAYDVPHEPGDPVPEGVPEKKLREWARAGVVEKAPAKESTEAAPPPVETPEPEFVAGGVVSTGSTSAPFTPDSSLPEFNPLAQPSTGPEVSPSTEPFRDEGDTDGSDN